MRSDQLRILLVSAGMTCVYFLLFYTVPFFWDTIQLSSKQAHHFYENGFFPILLPEGLDSGHPPFVGWYIAWVWTLLGKSIVVSHLTFVPFVFLCVYFALHVAKEHIEDKLLRMGWIGLVLTEPIFLSQTAIMSPDIILISGMLGLYVAFLQKNKVWMFISAFILAAVSMRGAMVLFAFCLFPLVYELGFKKRGLPQIIKQYGAIVPGALFFLSFLLYHYFSKNWIGFHEDSPWAGSFSRVDAVGLIKNVGLFGYRWMEGGKVFVLVGLLVLGWRMKRPFKDKHIFNLILLGLLSLVILFNTLPYAHLNANRYFWPVYLMSFILLATFLDGQGVSKRLKLLLLAAIFIHQTLIHFSDVRVTYSHDWEVSLIHWPYHNLREDAWDFLHENEIPLSEVGTAFPAINSDKHISLSSDERRMQDMREGDFEYLYYSNIMNSVKEEQLKQIRVKYDPIWQKSAGQIEVNIYKRKGEKRH